MNVECRRFDFLKTSFVSLRFHSRSVCPSALVAMILIECSFVAHCTVGIVCESFLFHVSVQLVVPHCMFNVTSSRYGGIETFSLVY